MSAFIVMTSSENGILDGPVFILRIQLYNAFPTMVNQFALFCRIYDDVITKNADISKIMTSLSKLWYHSKVFRLLYNQVSFNFIGYVDFLISFSIFRRRGGGYIDPTPHSPGETGVWNRPEEIGLKEGGHVLEDLAEWCFIFKVHIIDGNDHCTSHSLFPVTLMQPLLSLAT